MIDLHTHILPGLDDGADSLDTALAMARSALDDGITTVAATPHWPHLWHGLHATPELITGRCAELQDALVAAGLPLELICGSELHAMPELPAQLRAGAVLPYGTSKTVLVELPNHATPTTITEIVFAVQMTGHRVLLAHPERIKAVQRQPQVLLPLIERGALMQLTAAALTGHQGARLGEIAYMLLTQHMIHVLASDAHDLKRRPLRLARARRRAADLIGAEAAAALVESTPAALLHDEPLDLPPPQLTARRWWPF